MLLKNFFSRLCSLRIPEGDYVATITDVDIKRIKRKRLSLITFKFKLTNIDTGAKFTYTETIIDDFGLICHSHLAWIFEIYRIYCGDYYDLIGAVFDISVEHNLVGGKKTIMLLCNDLITPPCALYEFEEG